jgi:hypothetical protein
MDNTPGHVAKDWYLTNEVWNALPYDDQWERIAAAVIAHARPKIEAEARAVAIDDCKKACMEWGGFKDGYSCADSLNDLSALPPTHCTVSIDDLNKLRLIHKECEDGFYSCPLSTEGCLNDYSEGCTCGADEHNAAIDAMLSARKKP